MRVTLHFEMTDTELGHIVDAAERAGLSTEDYLVHAALKEAQS